MTGIQFLVKEEIFLFTTMSKMDVRPTQVPIQWQLQPLLKVKTATA
jgi:hypothetical protein